MKTTVTIDGVDYVGMGFEGNLYIYDGEGNMLINVFGEGLEGSISVYDPFTAGDYTLKIVQEEDEYDVIYDGSVTLDEHREGQIAPQSELIDGKIARLTFDGDDFGLAYVSGGANFGPDNSRIAVYPDEDDPTKYIVGTEGAQAPQQGTYTMKLIQYKTSAG